MRNREALALSASFARRGIRYERNITLAPMPTPPW